MDNGTEFKVPTAAEYALALQEIKITDIQRKMLEFHYHAHNRTATYTQLAISAGYESNPVANSQYGTLGARLGTHLKMKFVPLNEDDPKSLPFYSSAIGTGKKYFKFKRCGNNWEGRR